MIKILKYTCNQVLFRFGMPFLMSLIIFPSLVSAQQNKIEGRILDEKTKEPLVGATVFLPEKKTGTVSDQNGNFTVTVQSLPAKLTLSYIDYKQQVVVVYSTESPVNVNLKPTSGTFEEVVVVGYTTAKKSGYTGSVAVVGTQELERLQITSTGKALQGTIPGLQSIAQAGQLGSDASLYVRGIGSDYALQYFEVPSRMVVFKGENHELSRSGKPINRIKRLDEITRWFDKYLKY